MKVQREAKKRDRRLWGKPGNGKDPNRKSPAIMPGISSPENDCREIRRSGMNSQETAADGQTALSRGPAIPGSRGINIAMLFKVFKDLSQSSDNNSLRVIGDMHGKRCLLFYFFVNAVDKGSASDKKQPAVKNID